MTRGRKPNAPPEIVEPDLDQPRIDNAMAVMRQTEADKLMVQSQQEAAVRAVAAQIGYQLPADCTDPDLIQRDVAANMRRSVESCLEVGRGLMVLKQACGHGNFMARLDVLGIDHSVAKRFMQSAAKFSNGASTHLLKAAGTQTKLFELLVLDDEQLEELELTGQTGELKLDDIATMSVKELRAALRESRAENQAKEELLADKNKLLDKERAKARRIQAAPPDEVLAQLAQEVAEHTSAALDKLNTSVRSGFTALAQHYVAHGGTDCRHLMAGHVAELQKVLNELRDEFNLRDIEGDGRPEWADWSPDGATAG